MNYARYLSRAAGTMQESPIRKMGLVTVSVPDLISFAPGYPCPETFPWDAFHEITADLLGARKIECRHILIMLDSLEFSQFTKPR